MPFSLLILLLIPMTATAADRCDALATLADMSGEVRVTHADTPFPERNLSTPHDLCPGDQIQTVSKARALIHHPDGEVVMAADSRLSVLDTDEVQLASGKALFQVEARSGKRMKSGTPSVVIGVKGTRFLVSSNEGREDIALLDGRVHVERRDGRDMAYYRAPERDEMTFQEYREYQQRSFQEFVDSFNQDFADYKEQLNARFEAYVAGVELEAGRQLTLGLEGDEPQAVEAPVDDAITDLHDQLAPWLGR